jgi:hypothetical protein
LLLRLSAVPVLVDMVREISPLTKITVAVAAAAAVSLPLVFLLAAVVKALAGLLALPGLGAHLPTAVRLLLAVVLLPR